MEEVRLSEIKHDHHPDELVCDWDYTEVCNGTVRVYYKTKIDTGKGFSFYALENIGGICTPEYEKDIWSKDDCFVDCIYNGVSYFDGVRHLYMGDEKTFNYGYHYYPNLQQNIIVLQVLQVLEEMYCSLDKNY